MNFNDPDITLERLTEKYNADLANGLGNLVSRVLKLSEKLGRNKKQETRNKEEETPEELTSLVDEYRFADAIGWVMGLVREANRLIDEEKPWALAKTDPERFEGVMQNLLAALSRIASALAVLLPATSEKIGKSFEEGKVEPLFFRVK